MTQLDPGTPVVVGVGQASDPVTAPGYHRWSAADLAAAAAREALRDAGIGPASVDTVAGVRQFENSTPFATAPLGRAGNYPRAVAARVGAEPARAVLEVAGGQGPQHLVTEFAKAIARGQATTVLLFGSEAISTARALAGVPGAPDFTEAVGGQLEDRGYGLEGLFSPYELDHDLFAAPPQYALCENARRHRLGLTREAYARRIGELFEPFTRVAAGNPHAAARTPRSAAGLMTVTERNRLIADPYPRFVVSRDQVNQGAAVILTSVRAARSAGIPPEKWVFLHGYADLRERDLLGRPDLSAGPASVRASVTALERAGTPADEIDAFDLYSCFAIPVFNLCDGLGLSPADPRGLTLTGGLPFFGGAGNNYSMHAIAEAVAVTRARPGARVFVGANGGIMSKYSAGVYSAEPRPFALHSDAEAQAAIDAAEPVPVTRYPDGKATVETYTVTAGRGGARVGVVVGRLPDGSRTLAVTAPDDRESLEFLTGEQPFGAAFTVTPGPVSHSTVSHSTVGTGTTSPGTRRNVAARFAPC
jgi:acetyl-CoA C-acetyltransferase